VSYLDQLNRLADGTADRVVAIVASWQDGDLTEEEATALIVAVIEAGHAQATVLADAGLAADLTVTTGTLVAPVALVAASQAVRLRKAATTLLAAVEDTPDPQARARRLGRSEPLTRAAEARGEAIAAQPEVTGWVRQLNGEACQLCVWWSRDGRGWPADHPMPTHPGCTCTQQPITRKESA